MARRTTRGAARRPSGFDRFLAEHEPTLRRALTAAYGRDAGRDATVEALAWAWTNWAKVQTFDNPVGYLFRVGQSKAKAARTASLRLVPVGDLGDVGETDRAGDSRLPWVEPDLDAALDGLTDQQRVAVVLCHGFEWTHREVADLLDLSPSTIQNHVERGLAKLRRALEVPTDV